MEHYEKIKLYKKYRSLSDYALEYHFNDFLTQCNIHYILDYDEIEAILREMAIRKQDAKEKYFKFYSKESK